MSTKKLTLSLLLLVTGLGIVYFGLALIQINITIADRILYFPISNDPTMLQLINILGVIACMLIMAITAWHLTQDKSSNLDSRYEHIESSTLDSDPGLCAQFYTMAFDYREEHGQKKYQRDILDHFNFFYDFHNKALRLIDDLFTKTPAFIPSCDFVIATIKSGHIGPLFTDINYEGGISDANIRTHTPLIAHANIDSIDLWGSNASFPLCKLNKKQLKLERPNKTAGYVTSILLAEIKDSYKSVKIKLGFPDYHYDVSGKKIQQHDIIATQNYHQFENWIKKCAPKQSKAEQSNFGIDVEDNYDVEYGIPAPELINNQSIQPSFLGQALQVLKKTRIDAFFTRYDMPIVKQKSAMDALALCSGLGLVVISEQHTTGSVSYNGDAGWIVHENNRSQIIENACIQANRAKKSLSKFLKLNNLANWPIFSLVVFSANDIELNLKPGADRLQCDVIRLSQLEQWFATNAMTNKTRFTKDDHNKLALLLGNKHRQSTPRLKEA